jgi:hypothetical protein
MSNPLIEKAVDALSRFCDEHPTPTGVEVEDMARTLFALYHIGKMGVEPVTPSNRGYTISMRVDGLSFDLYRAGKGAMLEACGRELAEKVKLQMQEAEKAVPKAPHTETFLEEATTNGVLVMLAIRPLKPEEMYKGYEG